MGRGLTLDWDVETPVGAVAVSDGERLLVRPRYLGADLQPVQLPVCDGSVPAEMIADAVAATNAWTMLGLFFAEPEHDARGWERFLRALWGPPAETRHPLLRARHARAGWVSVEIGDVIPPVWKRRAELHVEIRMRGRVIGAASMHERRRLVQPGDLRAAITEALGFELCRAAVREALVGRPAAESDSLRDRLRPQKRASVKARAVSGDPAPGYATAVAAAGIRAGLVVGRRRTTAPGTAGFRTLALPSAAAADVLEAAQRAREPVVRVADGDALLYSPALLARDDPQPTDVASVPAGDGAFSAERFESIFATEDPWDYTSAYEQHKYEQTLSLVPAEVRLALELACGEGHFTEQLSARAEWLIASDVARTALAPARERCAHLRNVEFRVLDVFRQQLPGPQDLIVCSEVLYFAGDRVTLDRAAVRIHDALRDGGHLVTAHFHSLRDEPDRSGFNHGVPFGVATITDALRTAGLVLERELVTPQYRAQRYRRGGPATEARVAQVEAGAMPGHVARHFRPAGAPAQPLVADRGRSTAALPILMYHRVADSGPPALDAFRITPGEFARQMELLARHSFRTVTLEEWRAAADARRVLPGRAVLLTFDDGYADFADHAVPILRRHGFGALVNLVTDRVGQVNDWDEGELPLMSWGAIRELYAAGVSFGAHTATHPRLTALSAEAVVREASRARSALTEELGRPPEAFAYPYGSHDEAIARLVGGCGFSFGLLAAGGSASLGHDLLVLPRIEITGNDDLAAFARKVGIS